MGDAGRPYSGSQWLGRHFGGGARGGGLELEFQLEFDSHEGFEVDRSPQSCPPPFQAFIKKIRRLPLVAMSKQSCDARDVDITQHAHRV